MKKADKHNKQKIWQMTEKKSGFKKREPKATSRLKINMTGSSGCIHYLKKGILW